ncbi:prolactin-3D4-like [Phodopus roborovskii]|uniref:prolactin-3D4-like n=1 Tax=Phodopus roborovskii TaxID=109678 RepID=UPI0021E50A04|nr:prolactin-3D4-like [Phodopus roborovskii]
MQLTLAQPCSLIRLLLLLTNLFFWKHVSSEPNVLSTAELYDHALEQAHSNSDTSLDIYHEFNVKFAKASWLNDRLPTVCHTASIWTPTNIKQFHETKAEDILKAVISISRAWDYPLLHLVLRTAFLPKASNNMLQRTNDLKNGIIILLEDLEIILSRMKPGAIENDYPHWSGLREFQSSDEDTQLFAMYNLLRCLQRDTQKVESYLKALKYQVIFKNNY